MFRCIFIRYYTGFSPVPFRSHVSCLIYSAITATRYNCSYLQVKNILLTIYKYTYYLIYFQIITVEYIDHVLICTDHVVVCRIIQYANKNPSATDKVFMRYRSVIYLGRSGQPSRFLCQVRRPTLRDSLSSLNGYSCKTRKRSRRKGLPYSLPIEVGRLYGLYPDGTYWSRSRVLYSFSLLVCLPQGRVPFDLAHVPHTTAE